MSEFKGTKEEKAKHYSENWEEITGLDWGDSIPVKVSELDYLAGYNQSLEDCKAHEMLELLNELLLSDSLTHEQNEKCLKLIKEATTL